MLYLRELYIWCEYNIEHLVEWTFEGALETVVGSDGNHNRYFSGIYVSI